IVARLNGRPAGRLIDPDYDLTQGRRSLLGFTPWVLTMDSAPAQHTEPLAVDRWDAPPMHTTAE
ncbi:MAG: hypothetical protein AAF809_15735, partial [Bacteroidota bacterium]